ncbi:MAG: MGMT family protein [Planctomycetaceae bacterium]
MARRKSWNEKLHDAKDLPKVVQIDETSACTWGRGSCVVPAPLEVDHLMRQVKRGRVVTSKELRDALATAHGTDVACPIVTGIFCGIAAHAAVEAEELGEARTTPWWRTLKAGGELNPKYPGGIERQRALLEAEGHTMIARGKRWFVHEHERRLANLTPKSRMAREAGSQTTVASRRTS